MTILSHGIDYVELPQPISTETDIEFPFDMVTLDNGTKVVYDNGEQYDKRICKCKFLLNPTQQQALNTFLNTTARAQELILDPGVTGGFHPFGPDKGDAGNFSVTAMISGTPSIMIYPFRYFECELILVNTGSYPAYSLPSEVDDGSWNFGAVENLHYPQAGFKPGMFYSVSISHTENSTPYFIDRGKDADYATSNFILNCNESKAAAMLYYLTHTIRANSFSLYTRSYFIIFGIDYEDGDAKYVMIDTNKIKVKQVNYDNWTIELRLAIDFKEEPR